MRRFRFGITECIYTRYSIPNNEWRRPQALTPDILGEERVANEIPVGFTLDNTLFNHRLKCRVDRRGYSSYSMKSASNNAESYQLSLCDFT